MKFINKDFCRKIIRWAVIFVMIIVLGGFAGILAERFVIPWLSSQKSLKGVAFLQKANEKVTVINKTEQITVKENFSVVNTAQPVLPAVVSIIVYDGNDQLQSSAPAVQTGQQINIRSSRDIREMIKTGLILTSDGLIASMVTDAEKDLWTKKGSKYKVLLADGRELDAELKALDVYSNVVFLQVPASNLTSPKLGDSEKLLNGDKIILLGNAGGEYQTGFETGIIKEKDKTFTLLNSELSSSEKMEGAILTDALIDSKFLGGPVLDYEGTVVGLASNVEKDGTTSGFILPINVVKAAMERYIKNGKIERPVLGIYYLSINREIALLNRLEINQGALVYSFTGQPGLAVMKGSAADAAGLRLGDIVTEIQGEKVSLDKPLSSLIANFDKGAKVEIKVIRQGKELTVSALLQ